MPVVVIGKTAVASRLLRYTEKEKAGGVEPRVLYSEGIRCRVPTAEREFAAVRRQHGKQGAKRKTPARYILPDPGEVATLVRSSRPNGRKYWAIASDGQTATHVRREGEGYVDELEAVHVIVSYGLDEVNPDDPDQVRRAFEFVATMMADLYPGVQMKLVGQADGAGKAFHVHCVQNAVIVAPMELDGLIWAAGRKMSGALTDINRLRERVDEYIEQYGADYGVEQKLPSVQEQKLERRSARDRSMAARGEISNHDIIRTTFENSMNDARSIDLASFMAVMAEHDVTVNHRVTRAGKPNETQALSYRLDDMTTPVRGVTLGDHYAFESAVQQLEANMSGLSRERRPENQHAGAARPSTALSADDIANALAVVEKLAHDERLVRLNAQMDADLPLAQDEDYDAAVEANRLGDATELARLAQATRDKDALAKKTRSGTTEASILDEKPQLPVAPPKPVELASPTRPALSWNERARAPLDEVQTSQSVVTERVVAKYLREKEAERRLPAERAAVEFEAVEIHAVDKAVSTPPAPAKPSFAISLSDLAKQREAARETTDRSDESASDLLAAATTPKPTPIPVKPARTTTEADPHRIAAEKRRRRLHAELAAHADEGQPGSGLELG